MFGIIVVFEIERKLCCINSEFIFFDQTGLGNNIDTTQNFSLSKSIDCNFAFIQLGTFLKISSRLTNKVWLNFVSD